MLVIELTGDGFDDVVGFDNLQAYFFQLLGGAGTNFGGEDGLAVFHGADDVGQHGFFAVAALGSTPRPYGG